MENNGIIALCVLVLLLGAGLGYGFLPTEKVEVEVEVEKIVLTPGEVQLVEVPGQCESTEAQDIVIPSINDDIYDKMFEDEIEALELEGLTAYDDEFDEDDFEDFLEETIENFDSLKSFSEDNDEEKITIINLGLEDEEDKIVKVYKEYKIKYELENSYDKLKAVVIAEGNITFDEDDGFEAEIVFSLK